MLTLAEGEFFESIVNSETKTTFRGILYTLWSLVALLLASIGNAKIKTWCLYVSRQMIFSCLIFNLMLIHSLYGFFHTIIQLSLFFMIGSLRSLMSPLCVCPHAY